MDAFTVYKDIQALTKQFLVGVVGPVRQENPLFIRRFMEVLALPEMGTKRSWDLKPPVPVPEASPPWNPSFTPKKRRNFVWAGGVSGEQRLMDCVGFLVPGAREIWRQIRSGW